MAELASSAITVTAVKTALGSSSNAVSVLNTDSGINKWSFYRAGALGVNGTTKKVELTADASPYDFGDFRRYDHAAFTPTVNADFDVYYNTGATNVDLTFTVNPEQLNIQELIPGWTSSTDYYFNVKAYSSSANRASESSAIATGQAAISGSSESPPSGHTNNQTYRVASASQVLTNVINVSTSYSTVYLDVFIGNGSYSRDISFDDGYIDVDLIENVQPYVDNTGPNVSSKPSAFSVVYPVVTTANNTKASADYARTDGDTTYGFYWYLVGLKLSDSKWYRLGNIACTAKLTCSGHTDTTIFSGTLNTAGASSNEYDSGSLSASQAFNYNEVFELEVTVSDHSSYNEYDLGTGAP